MLTCTYGVESDISNQTLIKLDIWATLQDAKVVSLKHRRLTTPTSMAHIINMHKVILKERKHVALCLWYKYSHVIKFKSIHPPSVVKFRVESHSISKLVSARLNLLGSDENSKTPANHVVKQV